MKSTIKTAAKKPKYAAKKCVASAVRIDHLEEMRNMLEFFKTHPEEGRALLVKAGIYTRSGKLTKAYGG